MRWTGSTQGWIEGGSRVELKYLSTCKVLSFCGKRLVKVRERGYFDHVAMIRTKQRYMMALIMLVLFIGALP